MVVHGVESLRCFIMFKPQLTRQPAAFCSNFAKGDWIGAKMRRQHSTAGSRHELCITNAKGILMLGLEGKSARGVVRSLGCAQRLTVFCLNRF